MVCVSLRAKREDGGEFTPCQHHGHFHAKGQKKIFTLPLFFDLDFYLLVFIVKEKKQCIVHRRRFIPSLNDCNLCDGADRLRKGLLFHHLPPLFIVVVVYLRLEGMMSGWSVVPKVDYYAQHSNHFDCVLCCTVGMIGAVLSTVRFWLSSSYIPLSFPFFLDERTDGLIHIFALFLRVLVSCIFALFFLGTS